MPDNTGELPPNIVIQELEGDSLGGRPTDLTDEIADQIVRLMGVVSYMEPACNHAGVPIRTARRWMAQGLRAYKAAKRAERNGQPPILTEQEARCLRFWHSVTRATAALEIQHAGNITRAAMGRPAETRTTERVLPDGTVERVTVTTEGRAPDWRASLAFLERTQFKRWGRKTAHLHEGKPAPGQEGPGPLVGGEVQNPGARLTLAAVREILAEEAALAGVPEPLALPAGEPVTQETRETRESDAA